MGVRCGGIGCRSVRWRVRTACAMACAMACVTCGAVGTDSRDGRPSCRALPSRGAGSAIVGARQGLPLPGPAIRAVNQSLREKERVRQKVNHTKDTHTNRARARMSWYVSRKKMQPCSLSSLLASPPNRISPFLPYFKSLAYVVRFVDTI
jgi:hypothetical protein